MNQDSFKNLQVGLAEISRLLAPFFVIWLLVSIGLGWLVKSLFILLALFLITPIVAVIGFRWWLKRNLIQGQCPVCNYEFMSLNKAEFQCPSCGETLKAEQGKFTRLAPPGTIDVDVVEVPAQRLED
ncbi:MAG TPA: hypothetical protein V6C64_10525 [Microcoleaceae cyanobacterium]